MMKRHVGWAVGAGMMLVAFAAPASAQVHVDVGVRSANIGARVVVGGPRVVYVPVDQYRGPVSSRRVIYPRRDDRYFYRDLSWDRRDKRDREYHRDVREARREYERDLREARRDYQRDLREAARDRRR